MRSLFVGMIALSASIAVVDAAQAQTHLQRLPSYSSMQAHIGHQRPAQYNLQPTQDDVEKINRDNRQLDLPASQDEITGAGQVPSEENTLTNRIEQEDPQLDIEILDICPTCGGVEDAPVHQRRWPIHHGFRHQPTQYELKALHQQDVTRDQARETDRPYDRLMSSSSRILRQHPARVP
jgi:hypothetical protein